MPPQEWGVMTQKPGMVFVHILDAEAPGRIVLPSTSHLAPLAARRFDTAEPMGFEQPGDVELRLDRAGRDPVDYAAAVEQILGDPTFADRLSARAAEAASSYTWTSMAARLRRVYADVSERAMVDCLA